MKTIYKGRCEFELFEEVSKKSGQPYRAIKIKIGDYEPSGYLFVNNEKMYCIEKAIESAQKQ